MSFHWSVAVAIGFVSILPFARADDREKPKATPVIVHQRIQGDCELVQRGQFLQFRDYSVIAIDGVDGELFSPELTPTDFIQPMNGAGKAVKGASKSGFVVRAPDAAGALTVLPRVVPITAKDDCPSVQEAVALAAKQRDSRRAGIQAKLYRPGVDDVTRPVPESSPQPSSATQPAAANSTEPPPTGKPKLTHGTVVLAVAVGPDGKVGDAKVVRSLDPWLDLKAIEEVRRWTFRPARKQGLPVTALMTVEVNFNLH